jgi:hypothetical protein
VSAREKVIGMMAGTDSDGELRRIAERMADEILAEHAHELAELIRWARDAYDNSEHHKIYGAMNYAANLIDPQVNVWGNAS